MNVVVVPKGAVHPITMLAVEAASEQITLEKTTETQATAILRREIRDVAIRMVDTKIGDLRTDAEVTINNITIIISRVIEVYGMNAKSCTWSSATHTGKMLKAEGYLSAI